jgi:hypothetical protein
MGSGGDPWLESQSRMVIPKQSAKDELSAMLGWKFLAAKKKALKWK